MQYFEISVSEMHTNIFCSLDSSALLFDWHFDNGHSFFFTYGNVIFIM